MKKRIDAVKMTRQIRDQLYEKTKGMSHQELLEFYRASAQKAHARLKVHSN